VKTGPPGTLPIPCSRSEMGSEGFDLSLFLNLLGWNENLERREKRLSETPPGQRPRPKDQSESPALYTCW
jgi:hypothetical protein